MLAKQGEAAPALTGSKAWNGPVRHSLGCFPCGRSYYAPKAELGRLFLYFILFTQVWQAILCFLSPCSAHPWAGPTAGFGRPSPSFLLLHLTKFEIISSTYRRSLKTLAPVTEIMKNILLGNLANGLLEVCCLVSKYLQIFLLSLHFDFYFESIVVREHISE